MKVRLPKVNTDSEVIALHGVLGRAADRSGLPDHQFVLAMSYFLEELAAEVARGRAVTLPGFGLFAAYPQRGNYRVPKFEIRFSAAAGFRQEVRSNCPVNSKPFNKLQNHRRNSSRQRYEGSRVFSTMEEIRRSIRRQMAGSIG